MQTHFTTIDQVCRERSLLVMPRCLHIIFKFFFHKNIILDHHVGSWVCTSALYACMHTAAACQVWRLPLVRHESCLVNIFSSMYLDIYRDTSLDSTYIPMLLPCSVHLQPVSSKQMATFLRSQGDPMHGFPLLFG